MVFSLKNKVILVTGGYGHLGKSITLGLAEQGASVYVLARDESKFSQAFAGSRTIHFQHLDVADTKSIQACFKDVHKKAGTIDVLINNAFYLEGQDPENMSDEEWALGIDGTLGSTFRCIREIIPYFKMQPGGKIINIASMYGMVSPDFSIYEHFPEFLNPPHYGAAKAGVIQLTKYYAAYLARYKVTVNCVSPGPFPSDEVQKQTPFIQALSRKNPMNRIGKPDELKGVFTFLCSNDSDFMTGQNLSIDGGWTIW